MLFALQNINYKSIAIFSILAMLFACKPDIKQVEAISVDTNQPMETATNMKIVYSSNGRTQMIMEAPTMLRFEGDNPYMELPEGFEMFSYDSLGIETSLIRANYAIQYEKDDLIDARNDVVVENLQTKEKLNTEQLIWDRKNGKIYTEKFVKITTGEEVLHGEGFESDDRFSSWVIKKPTGTFYIDTRETNDSQPAFDSLPADTPN